MPLQLRLRLDFALAACLSVAAFPIQGTAQDRTSAKTGAAAYDAYADPWRSIFIKHWKQEVGRVQQEISRANDEIAAAEKSVSVYEKKVSEATLKGSSNIGRLSTELRGAKRALQSAKDNSKLASSRLAELEKNDPPYLDPFRKLAAAAGLKPEDYERPDQIDAKLMQDIDARMKEKEKRAEASRKAKDEHDADGLVLMVKTVEAKRHQFHFEITGTVVNRRPKAVKYAHILFNVYDESGARVGTAIANINSLAPGERWKFKAVALGSDASKYRFTELAGR